MYYSLACGWKSETATAISSPYSKSSKLYPEIHTWGHNMHSAACAVVRCPSICPYLRLSICLSVTFVYCIETNKHILKLFSPSDSSTILVFIHQTLWQYSCETPLSLITGASNAGRLWKVAIFDQYLAYDSSDNLKACRYSALNISETVQERHS